MKTSIGIARGFVTFITALILFTTSAQADLVELRGYWTFDEDTFDSLTIKEISGVHSEGTHDGTLVNNDKTVEDQTIHGVSFNSIVGEPGNHLASGNYISFTNDSYAVINNTSKTLDGDSYRDTFDFGGEAFTISAWVKGLPDGGWEPYISKYGEDGKGYQLRRNSGTDMPTYTFRQSGDEDPSVNVLSNFDASLNDGEWHNLIAVYGGTYRELYMDGQLITRTGSVANDPGGADEFLVFSARYKPTLNEGNGGYEGFANIALDDVAVFSGALRGEQIEYIRSGNDPRGIGDVLVSPEQPVSISIDMKSASGTNGTKLTPDGNISRHWLDDDVTFDGSSYIKTNLPVSTTGLNGSFTASAWVYLDKITEEGVQNFDQSIFGNADSGDNKGLHLVVRNGHPHMGFYANDLTANGTTLKPGQWYYLTFQYDADDNRSQKIYLNGEQIAIRTGVNAFAGAKWLELGRWGGGNNLSGKLKGISIDGRALSADEISAQYLAQKNNPSTIRIEDFQWGKNNDEWYGGGGASLGNASEKGTYRALSMYSAPTDNAEKTINNQGDTNDTTSIAWGIQFTVLQSAPSDAVLTFDVVGGNTALDMSKRSNGGVGIALWDLDNSDFIRDGSNNIIYWNGNGNEEFKHCTLSLGGLKGRNLMILNIDRQTGNLGWAGLTNLTADVTQIGMVANAAQHHLILNDFNFDTAGDFSGMYEFDSEGNKLAVTNFTNGNRGNGNVTRFYVDCSGTFDNGNKGFLSSGANGQEEMPTGVLRSDPFLVQGDILEFYIAGGNNINNKHLDLVDADNEQVYFSATGENTNDFRYDFWQLKDIQGKSVYIRVVDEDGGTSWSHIELDQIRQVKFAPTAAEVQAAENKVTSAALVYDSQLPGLNADTYEGVSSLEELANSISTGSEPTKYFYLDCLNNFEVESDSGVHVYSTLDVESSGLYTLAIENAGPYKLSLNGETYESDRSDSLSFIPLALSEVGQYDFDLLYLSNADEGVSLYLAQGAFDSWNNNFNLLGAAGNGYVHSYYSERVVPEPSTWALLVLGVCGLLYWCKRS